MRCLVLAVAATAAAVALLPAATAQANCSNPLFSDDISVRRRWNTDFDESPRLAPTPIRFVWRTKVCRAFKDKPSCCTADTLRAVERQAVRVYRRIAKATNNLSNARDIRNFFARLSRRVLDRCTRLGGCPAEASAVVANFNSTINTMFATVQQDARKCRRALFTYMQGMLCMSCDPNWASFVNPRTQRVVLKENVCDRIDAACTRAFDNNKLAVQLTRTFARDLINAILRRPNPPPVADMDADDDSKDQPDRCGGNGTAPGDCRRQICARIMRGASLQLPEGADPEDDENDATPEWVSDAKESGEPLTTARLLRGIDEASEETLAAATEQHIQHLESRMLLLTAGDADSASEYSASGYDAVSIGASDTGYKDSAVAAASAFAASLAAVFAMILAMAVGM